MPTYRRDDQVLDALGRSLPGAQVYYLTQPAITVPPYGPLATVFANSLGASGTNPGISDGYGRASAYMAAGVYTVIYVHPLISPQILPDQQVGGPGSSSGSGGRPFAEQLRATVDGQTQLQLTNAPISVFNTTFLRNGVQQFPNVDFTLSGQTITLFIPASVTDGDAFYCFYYF